MSEMHAAIALEALLDFDANLARRRALADRYRRHVAEIPGVRAQSVTAGEVSTYKDFTVLGDHTDFGLDRDVLVAALAAEGIDTRTYFRPPIHRQQAYAAPDADLPVTDRVASQVVSLPIYPSLADEELDLVAETISRVHAHAERIGAEHGSP
jgi:dTDP-4-amino-4,6-dideoxygalactose transaminase